MRGIISIFIWVFVSCSEDERVDRLSLLALAKKADASFSIVLAEKIGGGPTCEGGAPSLSYGRGCQKVFRAKVKELEFAFVEFDNPKNAFNEAKRLNQFYYKNWVLDEVYSEPPLEDFVRRAFGAFAPMKKELKN